VPYERRQPGDPLATVGEKWWEGYDPRMLYGINLRCATKTSPTRVPPEQGIFQGAPRIRTLVMQRTGLAHHGCHQQSTIPTSSTPDGDSTGPFTGNKTGTGYKSDAMPRVIGRFYNRALATRRQTGHLQQIVKFHSGHQRGRKHPSVRSRIPKAIMTNASMDRRTTRWATGFTPA